MTFQTVQTVANGQPLRMFIEGYEAGRPGGPERLTVGVDITASHYQIVVDACTYRLCHPNVLTMKTAEPRD